MQHIALQCGAVLVTQALLWPLWYYHLQAHEKGGGGSFVQKKETKLGPSDKNGELAEMSMMSKSRGMVPPQGGDYNRS